MQETEIKIDRVGGGYVPATMSTTGEKPTRVCILSHGIFVTRSENGRFDRLAARLAGIGISSVRMDLSGHGSHPIPSQLATVSGMAEDILAVCDYLKAQGVETIDIVASSFSGALLSILVARGYGPRFNSIVLLNPVLDFLNSFIEAEKPEMAEIFSSKNIAHAFRTGSFNPVPHFTMSRAFLMDLMTMNVPSAYQFVHNRHLVLHGTADELISFNHTRKIVRKNRHAHWVKIPGAFHAFNREPHELAAHRHLLDWLRSSRH